MQFLYSHEFAMLVYTAIGVAAYWAKEGTKSKVDLIGFGRIFQEFNLPSRWRLLLEFIIFLSVGCAVALAVVKPESAGQALTAGFGWTGVFTTRR